MKNQISSTLKIQRNKGFKRKMRQRKELDKKQQKKYTKSQKEKTYKI